MKPFFLTSARIIAAVSPLSSRPLGAIAFPRYRPIAPECRDSTVLAIHLGPPNGSECRGIPCVGAAGDGADPDGHAKAANRARIQEPRQTVPAPHAVHATAAAIHTEWQVVHDRAARVTALADAVAVLWPKHARRGSQSDRRDPLEVELRLLDRVPAKCRFQVFVSPAPNEAGGRPAARAVPGTTALRD
jgi:hypothetical protein